MTWWQFSLDCGADELDRIEQLMVDLGALSISLADAGDDPIYEPLPGSTPVWRESILTATFGEDRDPERIEAELGSLLPPRLAQSLRRHPLEDRDWEQAYRQHFQPLRCAPRLWIVPSWCAPPEPEAINIRLDPGLAFGTGAHPTTFLCLSWLAAADLRGLDVIDYGCGSGILAIAACKLGARSVRAADIDPQALAACRANLAANELGADRVRISDAQAMSTEAADLLVANILAGPLVELAPRFARLVAAGGRILLSGILNSQLNEIQSAYRDFFEFDPAVAREDWVCISGRRIETPPAAALADDHV